MERPGKLGRDTILKQYHEIWNESWRYFRNYAEQLPLPEEKWEEAVKLIPIFVGRHPEHEEFARKVIIRVFGELERQDKAIRRGEQ